MNTLLSRPFLLAAGLLALAAVTAGCTAAAPAQAPRTISVAASGSVEVQPDIVRASVGYRAENADLQVALDESNRRITDITNRLQASGIAPDDISTARFSVFQTTPFGSQSSQRVFQVDNQVTVTIRDVARTGTILGEAVRAGANQVDDVRFTVEDDTSARAAARTRAVENARTNATQLARDTGLTLGEVLDVAEGTVLAPVSPVAFSAGLGGGAGEIPFNPGTTTVSMSVTVRFAAR